MSEPGYFDEKEPEKVIEMVQLGIAKYSLAEASISQIKAKYNTAEIMKGDLNDKDTYKLAVEAIRAYREPRIAIGKERVKQGEAAREHISFVNKEGGRLAELLEPDENEKKLKAWKDDFDTAKEIEKREAAQAEELRVDTINERIASIKALVEANISSDSEAIKRALLGLMEEDRPSKWANEFAEKATGVIETTLEKLEELFTMKKTSEETSEEAEAKAAQLEKEREAREEQDRLNREAENKRVAEENEAAQKKIADQQKAIDDANAKLKADQKQIDADKLAAENIKKKALADAEKVKQDAIDAEDQRIEDNRLAEEEAKREEREAKEAQEKADKIKADAKAKAEADKKEKIRLDKEKAKNLEKREGEAKASIETCLLGIPVDSSTCAVSEFLFNFIKEGQAKHITFE